MWNGLEFFFHVIKTISLFVPFRSHLSASWYGFSDPQSGLGNFVWKAGTAPGGDDIFNVTFQHIHLNVYARSLPLPGDLPTGKRIYVTVGCYNNAGNYIQYCYMNHEVQRYAVKENDILTTLIFKSYFSIYLHVLSNSILILLSKSMSVD